MPSVLDLLNILCANFCDHDIHAFQSHVCTVLIILCVTIYVHRSWRRLVWVVPPIKWGLLRTPFESNCGGNIWAWYRWEIPSRYYIVAST